MFEGRFDSSKVGSKKRTHMIYHLSSFYSTKVIIIQYHPCSDCIVFFTSFIFNMLFFHMFSLGIWEGHGINEATAAAGGLWIAWGNWPYRLGSTLRLPSREWIHIPPKGKRKSHWLHFVPLERGYSLGTFELSIWMVVRFICWDSLLLKMMFHNPGDDCILGVGVRSKVWYP